MGFPALGGFLGAMKLWVRLSAVVVGGVLGAALRFGLLHRIGDEVVALGAVNAIGCFLIGVASGLMGPYASTARLFLFFGALGAFTSWASLWQGVVPADILIAFIETFVGAIFVGLGHLGGMKLRRVED